MSPICKDGGRNQIFQMKKQNRIQSKSPFLYNIQIQNYTGQIYSNDAFVFECVCIKFKLNIIYFHQRSLLYELDNVCVCLFIEEDAT